MAFYIPVTFCLIFVLSMLPVPSHSFDPSPLQDFCVADLNSSIFVNGFPCRDPETVTSDDFFFDGFNVDEREFNLYGINVSRGNVRQFPGLNTQGISLNRVEVLEGGLIPPHTHPRASELALLYKGTVLAGLVSTENVFYSNVMTAGMLFVIPQGLLHTILNIGNESAVVFATFNSQNAGIQFQPIAHFNSTPAIPDEILRKAFNVNQTIIDVLKSALGVPLVSTIHETLQLSAY